MVSSSGNDFNYDFHVKLDPNNVPLEYNFLRKKELYAAGLKNKTSGKRPGSSVLKPEDGQVYYTYSPDFFDIGIARPAGTCGYIFLDLTLAGRQEGLN